jgi:hypothetical protein
VPVEKLPERLGVAGDVLAQQIGIRRGVIAWGLGQYRPGAGAARIMPFRRSS